MPVNLEEGLHQTLIRRAAPGSSPPRGGRTPKKDAELLAVGVG